MLKKRNLQDVIKGPAHILYHATLIALSGSVAALSLPYTADFIVTRLMIFWTFIGNEKISLISVGIALTMVLILFLNYMMLMILFNYSFNYIARSWKDRKVSRSANRAVLRQAISAGAEGYLLKENTDSELFPAIETVRHGGIYVSPFFGRTGTP